mgnify:CR=1 FL=1|tara:strand:+ start:279 stop:1475 length:1197 start_codon:yes stop_codon:yes gene_type:complete
MKLGIFVQNYVQGGMDTFLINLINNISCDEVFLFYNKGKNIERVKKQLNKKINIIEYNKILSNPSNFSNRLIIKILNIYNFTFGMFINFISLKKIFKNNKFDKFMLVCGGYPGGCLYIPALLALNTTNKNRLILNIHNYPVNINNYNFIRKTYESFLDYLVSKLVCKIITVSKSCKNYFINRPKLKEIKIEFIHNGTELLSNSNQINSIASENLKLSKNKKIIFFPGVIEKRKGHEVMIKAMDVIIKKNQNIHLIICGNGNIKEENDLKNLINTSVCKNRISLLNFQNDLSFYYSKCSIVVIPSLNNESFGYTAIEAMSFKKPVICSKIGGLKEIVENNYNGLLVEPNSENDLANAILSLINDENKIEKLGINGWNLYLSNYNSKIMAENYYNSLNNI